jgi:hypothetical protein
MVKHLGVAVSLHADPSASSSGDILFTLLDEVADQTIIAEYDHLDLLKREKLNRIC